MNRNGKVEYVTRMYLRDVKGWTNKMIQVLLEDVKYKPWGNFYGNGIIKLYHISDIEKIEKTKVYKELKEKIDKRREKTGNTKYIEKEKRKLKEQQQLRNLAKFYEEDECNIPKTSNKMEFTKHKWQEQCLNYIKGKRNIILASPTGSGKTTVFLEWALNHKERPIYITSPIKSLSNQRYRELTKLGYIVGIETGDIKHVPANSEFVCCTQEIYTNKYMIQENATLIMDEFHYIFENQDRARAYIDALNGSRANNIFICSATLGNLNKIKKYIDKVTNRNFYLYENKETLTELIYKSYIPRNQIKNSLVIAFSVTNCKYIAKNLSSTRNEIIEVSSKCKTKYQENFKKIEGLAIKHNIQIDKLANKDYLNMGIAVYYGSLLPKEKLFIEEIFEEKLIDTVVGTDALALGVNFPVKNVVFAQLSKYYEGRISKNLFQQLSGRAGRKDYFDIGYVYYCSDFFGRYDYYYDDDIDIKYLYNQLLIKENESIKIELTPIISKILKGTTTIQEEVKYISENSTENVNIEQITNWLNSIIKYINTYKIAKKYQDEFRKNIADVYFDEYNAEINCYLFSCILQNQSIEQIIKGNYKEFEAFNSLLQLRKYLIHLPKKYRKKSYISSIEEMINEIDDSVLTLNTNI